MRKFFQRCAEIEEGVAAIYRQLANSSLGDRELRQIWLGLASEEEDHARQIRLAGRLPEDETVRGTNIPLPQVEQLRDRVAALLQEVKTDRLTLPAALQLCLRLEAEFGCVHAHCAAQFIDERMVSMFQSLAWDDSRHAQTIGDYCRANGVGLGEVE